MTAQFAFKALYTVQGALVGPLVTVGLGLFLFGFYALLYGLVVYFLCTRPNVVNRKLHLIWTTSIFLISTLGTTFDLVNVVIAAVLGFKAAESKDIDPLFHWESSEPANFALTFLAALCYVITNCIADTVLIYRCYIIWGSRKRVIALPVIASVVTNSLGLAVTIVTAVGSLRIHAEGKATRSLLLTASHLRTGYYATNAAVNFVITFMIAGGIWWTSRDSRRFLGNSIRRQYRRVVAVVVESGVLYSSCLVIYVSIRENISNIGFPLDFFPLIVLMAGIAPTLIILRTNLGRSSKKAAPETRVLSTLRFEATPTVTEDIPGHLPHNQDSQGHNTDLEVGKNSMVNGNIV